MSKIPEYQRGRKDGYQQAVAWLHERAKTMNDPHAKAILNSAATNLGWDFNRSFKFAPASTATLGDPHGEAL